MSRALMVLNPNSSQAVTAGIDAAVTSLRAFGIPIRCIGLSEGPPGIECQRDADLAVPPLLGLAARLEPDSAGYVIACFGDPGLHALRDQTALPVVGIQEAAVAAALTLGQRVEVIAILARSIPRHLRAFGAIGVMDRLAGDRARALGMAEPADPARTLPALIASGRALRDRDGAAVLILGCAGMAAHRAALEEATGLPVVEPCLAAVSLALSRIALSLSHRPKEPPC